MRRVAISSLFHDRGKLVAALAGVMLSSTLAMVQLGLYAGFIQACSAIITHAGGDLWVMSEGTPVFDNGRLLPSGTREVIAEHPCVARVRGIAIAWVDTQTKTSPRVNTFVVGFEPVPDAIIPWSLEAGLPQDLAAPMRVSVDRFDLPKYRVEGDPLGTRITVGGQPGQIAAVTSGIKTFTLTPYMFSNIENVRVMAGIASDQSTYYVVDLKNAACAADVTRWIERRKNLQVRTSEAFQHGSEDYWMAGSGAGAVLAFGTLLGLLVGGAIVAQTLYAMTRDHAKELAALKAIGASRGELTAFVAWQAAFLAIVGGVAGIASAAGLRVLCMKAGLNLVLSSWVIGVGLGSVFVVCAVSSLLSVRAVFNVDPATVFR